MRFFRRSPKEPIEEDAPESVAVTVRAREVEVLRKEISLPDMTEEGNDPMADIVYYRVLQEAHGHIYELCQGGVPFIVQDYDPDLEGNVPMDKEVATIRAEKALTRYLGVR